MTSTVQFFLEKMEELGHNVKIFNNRYVQCSICEGKFTVTGELEAGNWYHEHGYIYWVYEKGWHPYDNLTCNEYIIREVMK